MTSKQNNQNADAKDTGSAAAGTTDLGAAAGTANGGKAPQSLDRWFDDQLNQLFNDVSSEPLPADLAKLIGQLKAQGQK